MSEVLPPFVPFGPAHLVALALTALVGMALARWLRKHGDGRPGRTVRYALAGGLLSFVALEVTMAVRGGWARPEYLLPLHLCDAAIVLAICALLTLSRPAAELLYFWAGAGTTVAMLTPDLSLGFPRWEFFVFFGLHGLVVVSALALTFGYGLAPRPGAAGRAFLATLLYAALVGAIDVAGDFNFMFLRAKPETPTLLDFMGPWPVYVLVGAVIALGLFQLLALPFSRARPSDPPAGVP